MKRDRRFDEAVRVIELAPRCVRANAMYLIQPQEELILVRSH